MHFDITDYLVPDAEQELVVSVYDPSDGGSQPRGKQMARPGGTYYSGSSGIWQTVWLEPVPETSIEMLRLTPDIDSGVLEVLVATRGDESRRTI